MTISNRKRNRHRDRVEVEIKEERAQQRNIAAAACLFEKPLAWTVGREGGRQRGKCMGFYFLGSGTCGTLMGGLCLATGNWS